MKHYGHAGPLFVEELIKRYANLKLPTRLDAMLQAFGTPLSAQDMRVARSFAVAALAGELAIEWGILPWDEKSALIAAIEIFNHWKTTQPQSAKSKEAEQLLKAVRDFIQTYGACFSDINWVAMADGNGRIINPEPVVHERAGYWKQVGKDHRIYLFTAHGLHKPVAVLVRAKPPRFWIQSEHSSKKARLDVPKKPAPRTGTPSISIGLILKNSVEMFLSTFSQRTGEQRSPIKSGKGKDCSLYKNTHGKQQKDYGEQAVCVRCLFSICSLSIGSGNPLK
jgi:hypothetical protein